MGFWDYYRGTLKEYHRDPFSHSVLRTRETNFTMEETRQTLACAAFHSVASRKVAFGGFRALGFRGLGV